MSSRSTLRAAPEDVRQLARYFYALKDGLRLELLAVLASRDECTVNQLAEALRISQPLVSWHLQRLKAGGLVKVRRQGRAVYCSLDRESIERHQREFLGMIGGPS